MPTKDITILKLSYNKSGGLEKQTNLIANALLDKGYKINFITTKNKDNSSVPPKNISFHFIKKWPIFSFLRILFFEKQTLKWIKKNKPKIILGIDRTTQQTHIRVGNGVHKAYLKNRRTYFGEFNYIIAMINPLHHLILRLEKKAFLNPSLKKIIVNSKMVKDQILKYYSSVPPEKIKIIHNGVEWKKSEQSFTDSFINTKNDRSTDIENFNFLFVGNGYKRKGLDCILLAVSKLKNKNFHISIVGKDKKIEAYKKYVKKLGISQNITFHGKQNDLTLFYKFADALLLPTLYDPFANVTVEALSMGLFTITSKENGGKEVINSENGIIIDNLKDTNEIVKCLEDAIKKGKKTFNRAIMIRNSVKHLDIAKQLDKVINTLLN